MSKIAAMDPEFRKFWKYALLIVAGVLLLMWIINNLAGRSAGLV
jgi:hypothetical protein